MGYNTEIRKDKLSSIRRKDFKEAIYLCYRDGITSRAPLGFSGDSILLFGDPRGGTKNGYTTRKSVVSIRNHCRDAELLITDQEGNFLFYGGFDINLGVDFVLNQYWAIFKKVRHMIEDVTPEVSDFANVEDSPDMTLSAGFAMLKQFQLTQTI